jgi:hypothetical protein
MSLHQFVTWQAGSAAFFVYVALIAWIRPPAAIARRRAVLGAFAGTALSLWSMLGGASPVVRHWILPPALLLIGYWSSGALFVAPMPRAEVWLMAMDRALRVTRVDVPRLVAEILELAYVGVYPLILLALIVHVTSTPSPDADRFWSVVLITDYICFAMLPWVQTRPPRALESREPWASSFRAFNLKLLGAASIRVNTFPSGHAAEGLAAALLVLGAGLPVVAAMVLAALAVSAGAVLGRYHYAADAIAGWLVAIVVWWWVVPL